QHGGPTSTASGSMNNGFGPPSLSHGPPTNAQPMTYQDLDPSHQQQPQQMPPPPYNMHPMNPSQSQPPPQMMQQPGPPQGSIPNGPGNPNLNPQQNAGIQSQMMLRPPIPMSHIPQPPLLEYRILEMNKRMYSFNHQQYQVAPELHPQWWEAFGQEFFDDDSRLNIITYETPDNPKKYTVSKKLIGKFFRTMFENGVRELQFLPRAPTDERMSQWGASVSKKLIGKFFRTMFENGVRELQFLPRAPSDERMSQWGACSLDCENVVMFTRIHKPVNAHVVTEARMFLEFAPYDEAYGYRIKQFTLELKNSQEYILRQPQDMEHQERIKYNITKCGIPIKAINFLKLCIIMEPMQLIVNYCKQNPMTTPRDALKHILFREHSSRKNVNPPPPMPQNIQPMQPPPPQNMMPPQPPPEEVAKKTRKRTRKNNNTAGGPNTTTPAKQRKGNSRASPSQSSNSFPINQNYNVQQYQEVLVVGEPSLMGADFGEEDERSISRIENTQYDGSMMNHGGPGSGMPQSAMNTPMSVGMPTNGSTPNYSRQNSFNRGIEYNVQQYQEVLVVGEPSLMGADFGEEDERSISRIENTQYDGSMMNHGGPGSGMPQSAMNTPMSVGMPTNGSTPNYSRQNSFNRGIEVQKMPPPQAAPLAHTSSSSQLGMLPPPYEMSMMNNAWKNNMPNSNNMNPSMMAQTICEQ
uniref:LIM interaction domain-containing protein n=1 Tax=Panagrolaimus sp. PS1159 TaxID=55785 RepID=A0AC35G770_9BILA